MKDFFLANLFLLCSSDPNIKLDQIMFEKHISVSPTPTFKSIEAVNSWVNHEVKYKRDKVEYWQTAGETLNTKVGDCEDYVIAKRQIILNSGLAKEDEMKVLVVWDEIQAMPHALLYVNGLILNSQTDEIIKFDSEEFRKRYSVGYTVRVLQ